MRVGKTSEKEQEWLAAFLSGFIFLFFEILIALKHFDVFAFVPFLTLSTAQKGILKLSLHYLIQDPYDSKRGR